MGGRWWRRCSLIRSPVTTPGRVFARALTRRSGRCFDRYCHGFAATQAECGNAAPAATTQQGIDERHQNTRAAGADRVPKGDCATLSAG